MSGEFIDAMMRLGGEGCKLIINETKKDLNNHESLKLTVEGVGEFALEDRRGF